MQLSPHFSLAELSYSPAAAAHGIANAPPPDAVDRLRQLCVHVLEPLRAHFGRPVRVNSGYRSPALNRAVGGARNSQHVTGEAADIEVDGVSTLMVAQHIRKHLPHDQLILELYTPGKPDSGWVHVSYRAGANRALVLTFDGKRYRPGLMA